MIRYYMNITSPKGAKVYELQGDIHSTKASRCSRAAKGNLESRSKGGWKKRVTGNLLLIHHANLRKEAPREGPLHPSSGI